MQTTPNPDYTIIIGAILLLSQLGIIAWIKWSFESMAEKVSRKLLEEHEEDQNAHARSGAITDLKIELRAQRQLLESIHLSMTELRAGCVLAKEFIHKPIPRRVEEDK